MKLALSRALPLIILAIVWELASRFELVSSSVLPSLSDVMASWWEMLKSGELITNGAASLYRTFAGLGLAVAIGIMLGIGMAWWKPVNALLAPLVEAFYPIPN